MRSVDAIILAGGLGTRLQSVVRDVPKVLAPINGQVFIDILLGFLENSGCVQSVVLALGYKAELVVEHIQAGKPYRFPLLFSVEGDPLGTGGAVRHALKHTHTDHVLILNGDSYINLDVSVLLKDHCERGQGMTIVVHWADNPSRYGSVEIGGGQGILGFREKSDVSEAGYINAGVYVGTRGSLASIPDTPVSIERDLFPGLVDKGELFAHVCNSRFIDIGIPSSYSEAQKFFGLEQRVR